MAFKVNIDVAGDCPLGDFMDVLGEYGHPTIVEYEARGPGGGNPNLTLLFGSEHDARALLKHWHPGEDEEFIACQMWAA